MEIKPIDMTTPLNVEMLKELRSTLAELTKQREMDDKYACMTLTDEQKQMRKIKDESTKSVMLAISHFCTPLVIANVLDQRQLPQ